MRSVFKSFDIPTYFKPTNTLLQTKRALKTRFAEHRRKSSVGSEVSQHVHVDKPKHGVSLDRVKILTVDINQLERGVKEAIYIRVAKPGLNKEGGHYILPAVWINLLRARVRGHLVPGPLLKLRTPTGSTTSSWSQLERPQRWLKGFSVSQSLSCVN